MTTPTDEMEDSLYEDHLHLPERASGLVNSPTTDTLDSVALETSPMDEQDLVGDVSLAVEQESAEDKAPGGTGEDDKNTGISFAPADISIDLNSLVMPSASETQILFPDTHPVKEADAELASGGQDEQAAQSISSYFASQGGGDDFFDSIGDKAGTDGGQDDTNQALQFSAFDELNSSEETAGVNASQDPPASTLSEDAGLQSYFQEAMEDMDVQHVDADVTHIIHHREHKISYSEPEPVSFEGVQMAGEEDTTNLTISDLTETEKDEFESFTAGEGSDVIQHTGLVERSDSLTHDTAVAPSSSTSSFSSAPQQRSSQGSVEEAGSMVHALSIQGPSLGNTPTTMSPQHSAGQAQPAVSPSGNSAEPPV
jgi:hypothetical protein